MVFLKCMFLAYLAFTFISLDPFYFAEGTDQRAGFLLTSVSFWAVQSLCNFRLW